MKTTTKVLLSLAMFAAMHAGQAQGQATAGGGGGGGGGGTGGRVILNGTAGPARARAGSLELTGPRSASATHTCEAGEELANLGIGTFHCQGGNCMVNAVYARANRAIALPEQPTPVSELVTSAADRGADPTGWDFTVEPSLWEIAAGGPAAGKIEDGDFLVAVNNMPITTRNAAFVLGNMVPGRPLALTLRRGGNLVTSQIFPAGGCRDFTVSAGIAEMPSFLQRDETGKVVRIRP